MGLCRERVGTREMTSRTFYTFLHWSEDIGRSLVWLLLDVLLAGLCVVIWSVAIERAEIAWAAVRAWL